MDFSLRVEKKPSIIILSRKIYLSMVQAMDTDVVTCPIS